MKLLSVFLLKYNNNKPRRGWLGHSDGCYVTNRVMELLGERRPHGFLLPGPSGLNGGKTHHNRKELPELVPGERQSLSGHDNMLYVEHNQLQLPRPNLTLGSIIQQELHALKVVLRNYI